MKEYDGFTTASNSHFNLVKLGLLSDGKEDGFVILSIENARELASYLIDSANKAEKVSI